MSDINVFYTPPVQNPANSSTHGKTNAAAGGGNFFDLIFARLTETGTPLDLTQPIAQETIADQPANDLTAMIDPALLADEADTGLDFGFDADLDPTLTDLENGVSVDTAQASITLDAAGMKKLHAILDSLMQGIPADQRPVILDGAALDLAALDISPADIDAASQSLIAAGLTPADLTALIRQIDTADTQTQMIGTLQLVEDGDMPQTIFLPKAMVPGKTGEATKPADKISASLTALTSTNEGETAPDPTAEGTKTIREARFDDILKMLELSQAEASNARGGGALGSQTPSSGDHLPAADMTGKPGPSNSSVTANFAGLSGSFMDNNAVDAVFPEGLDWSQNDSAISNARITGTAQLTSLITHARDATQAHPATMYVAATLVKGAKDGEAKTMTLRMDPPDLGKIEIHMHFSKNKELKAHMVFEKPETMLMMQRDSQMLERSLQESGLDGNALSFELASEDHDFENSHSRNGQNNGKPGQDKADDMNDIETTMNWTVDHATGLQHYNILV